jgi:transposase
VVELCRTGGKSIGDVARDLDLAESVLRRWVKQAGIDAGHSEGLTTAKREESRGCGGRTGCCGKSATF